MGGRNITHLIMKKFLGILPIVLLLAACDDGPDYSLDMSPDEKNEVDNKAARAANDKLSTDKVLAADVLKKLQEKNPNVVDAYFTMNDKKEQVLVISSIQGDGSIREWTSGPVSEIPAVKEASSKSEQSATAGSSNNWLLPALSGALLGYAAANMMSSSVGNTRSFSNYNRYDEEKRSRGAAYSGYVHSQTQSTARSSYMNSSAFKSNPARITSQPGVTRGAFMSSSGGARGASVSGG